MSGPLLFIADVHVEAAHPRREERIARFLDAWRGRADHLYILGDFFGYWIGRKHARLPEHASVLQNLREFAAGGTVVDFVHGNRDLLFDEVYARSLGFRSASESLRIRLDGRNVLLIHGDQFESHRTSERAYRWIIRSRWTRLLARLLPSPVCVWIAKALRAMSKGTQAQPNWTDSAPPARMLQEFRAGTDVIVCGHLHTSFVKTVKIDDRTCTLIVLGDWDEGIRYGVYEGGQWRIVTEPDNVLRS